VGNTPGLLTARTSIPVLVLLTLLAGPSARGQPAGASTGPPRVAVPGCYVLTPYGLIPTCTVSLSPVEQDELESRAAGYRTDGARVTAAPSAGPGAAYFHNASQALAAPTTSWVQTVDPELGAGSFGNNSAVAALQPSAARAKPSAAPQPSALPSDAHPTAQTSASSSAGARAIPKAPEPIETAFLPPPDTEPASPTGVVPKPEGSVQAAPPPALLPPAGPRGWRMEEGGAGAAGMPPMIVWLIVPIAALLLFLAVRAFASRALGL
jgi:hypothetical protein